jgi:hypothetical protein
MQYSRLDYDLDLLRTLIRIIDQHLNEICKIAKQASDPDSFGYFDDAEHITGLGFVACQTYLSSVYGRLKIDKRLALSVGPLHSSGQPIVQIINHAANYWKHNSEWSFDKNPKQRKSVEDSFKSAGFPVDTHYPLSGILTALASPDRPAFESILNALESWKDGLLIIAGKP